MTQEEQNGNIANTVLGAVLHTKIDKNENSSNGNSLPPNRNRNLAGFSHYKGI